MPNKASAPTHDPARYRARLKRVRAAISDAGCDALLITDPSDIHYLTPFGGEDSCAIVLPKSLIVVSDRRFEEELWELKGIAKVELDPGESATVTFPVSERDLSYFDPEAGAWAFEPGEFEFAVGSSSRSLPLRATRSVGE